MGIAIRLALALSVSLAGAGLSACFSSSSGGGGGQASFDSGSFDVDLEGGVDSSAGPEAGPDAAADEGVDSTVADSGMVEASPDVAPEASHEAGPDAPVEAGPEASVEASVDAAPETSPVGSSFYVDPVNGLDTNPGTMLAPFKSIQYASNAMNLAGASAAPFNLYLADGTYDATNQPNLQVFFTYPTFVRGSAAANVIILGQGPVGAQEGLIFSLGGGVANVTMKNTWYGLESLNGTFVIGGCSFDGAGQGGYFAAFVGNTVGTFDTTGGVVLQNLPAGSLGGIYVDATANVTWTGGGTTSITGGGGGTLVFMRGGGKLTIDGVNVTAWSGYVMVGYDQAQITWSNSTITGSGNASGVSGLTTAGAFYIGGSQSGVPSPLVALENTSVTGSLGSAVAIGLTNNTGTVLVTANNAHLDNSKLAGVWINGITTSPALAVNIVTTSTTFDGNGVAGIYGMVGSVTLKGAGSSVSSNGATAGSFGQIPGGIVLTSATNANAIVLRNTTVGGNTGNQLQLAGTGASSLDLGVVGDLGGITFSGVPANSSAVDLLAAINGSAIGDIWMPGVQGADTKGQYTVTTTITGPASGQNVTDVVGSSVVMAP